MLARHGLLTLAKGYGGDLRTTRKAVSVLLEQRLGASEETHWFRTKEVSYFCTQPISMPWDSSTEELSSEELIKKSGFL